MKTLPVLLRREIQEHRGALLIVPLIVTGFFVLLLALGLLSYQLDGDLEVRTDSTVITGEEGFNTLFGSRLMELSASTMTEREQTLASATNAISSPILLVLWIVVFFYLLGALYDERRDRSILFWKSMPVSDTMTVLSKLLIAVAVAPIIYLAGIIVVQLIFLLAVTVAALPYPVDVWSILWEPAALLAHWGMLIVYFLFVALWCLPFFGWMLFVSAFARSLPFLWALGIPFAIIVVERVLLRDAVISEWMARHSTGIAYGNRTSVEVADVVSRLASIEFLISFVVGIALIYGAIYMRGRGDEI